MISIIIRWTSTHYTIERIMRKLVIVIEMNLSKNGWMIIKKHTN